MAELVKICKENTDNINWVVYEKTMNIVIKQATEDYPKIVKPVAVALD